MAWSTALTQNGLTITVSCFIADSSPCPGVRRLTLPVILAALPRQAKRISRGGPVMPLRRLTGLTLIAAALTAAGCGDYESRMRDQQKRLERFDEENKYLEDALELRKVEDNKETSAPEVFVRAPKGISREAEKAALSAGGPYRYLKSQSKDGPFVEMHAAVGPATDKDFRENVVKALGGYFREGSEKRGLSRNPPDREQQIVFDGWENPQTEYKVFFCQQGGIQLALGFLPDKSRAGGSAMALGYCLDTVAFQSDAGKARTAWLRLSNLRRR